MDFTDVIKLRLLRWEMSSAFPGGLQLQDPYEREARGDGRGAEVRVMCLEAGEDKETDSPLEPPEGTNPAHETDFGLPISSIVRQLA